MGLSCGGRCLKIILASINIIFFIGGLMLLGFGIWASSDPDIVRRMDNVAGRMDKTMGKMSESMAKIHAMTSHRASTAVAVFGVFLVIVSFLGCCGALKEWRPLLIGYIIALLIVFIGIVAATATFVVYPNKLKNEMGGYLRLAIQNDYGNKKTNFTNAYDKMMKKDQCCGVFGAEKDDFANSPWWKEEHKRSDFPRVCCPGLQATQTNCSSKYNSFIKRGCIDFLFEALEMHKSNIVKVVGTFGAFILIGSCFACYLTYDIGQNQM